MQVPEWIDEDAWAEFVDMRKAIKKPLTQRAMERAMKRLQALKDAGHDPNASLVQSADHYWMDLYAPRDMPIEKVRRAEDSRAYLAERNRGTVVCPPEILERLRKVGR